MYIVSLTTSQDGQKKLGLQVYFFLQLDATYRYEGVVCKTKFATILSYIAQRERLSEGRL